MNLSSWSISTNNWFDIHYSTTNTKFYNQINESTLSEDEKNNEIVSNKIDQILSIKFFFEEITEVAIEYLCSGVEKLKMKLLQCAWVR